MTSPAAFNLVGAGFRPSVSGRPLTLTDQPGSHGGKLDPWGQSLAPASRFCMLLSVFMAGRAPNRYLSPAGIIAIGFRVIVANQSRGMAIRTLVVPVLVNASPVHGVARMVCTWLIQPKPALPSGRRWPGIPGDIESLQAAIAGIQQVLLKGINAKGVFYGPGSGFSGFLYRYRIFTRCLTE